MARNLPARTPATAVRYYPMPTTTAAAHQQLVVVTPAQLAAYERQQALVRQQDRIRYAKWKARQDVVRQRDARLRRFAFGAGAVFGLAILAVLTAGGLWVYHLATRHGGDAIAGGLLVAMAVSGLFLLGMVGHRCITIVQHGH